MKRLKIFAVFSFLLFAFAAQAVPAPAPDVGLLFDLNEVTTDFDIDLVIQAGALNAEPELMFTRTQEGWDVIYYRDILSNDFRGEMISYVTFCVEDQGYRVENLKAGHLDERCKPPVRIIDLYLEYDTNRYDNLVSLYIAKASFYMSC